MMKIQCPHCSTGYTISEKELQLSKGAVQCGKCMNTFDANQSIIEEEPVFDHSSAFIEPLSSNEISQDKQGLRLDDLVPDSSHVEFKDGSVVSMNNTASGDFNQMHSSQQPKELAEILEKRKSSKPQDHADSESELVRPRVNEESIKSIKDSYDPQLSVSFEDNDLIFIPNQGSNLNDDAHSVQSSWDLEQSHVMELSSALETDVEEYVTQQSIQLTDNESNIDEPNVQIETTRLKSRLSSPNTSEKREPVHSDSTNQETTQEPESAPVRKDSTPLEPSINSSNIKKSSTERLEPAIKETVIEELISVDESIARPPTAEEQLRIDEMFVEQSSVTLILDKAKALEDAAQPTDVPQHTQAVSGTHQSTHNESQLIDEVDQLIDEKLSPSTEEPVSEPESDDDFDSTFLTSKKPPKKASRFFAWLILSPIYLILILLLSAFLIYQLWQKQLIFWPDRKDLQTLVKPVSDPVFKKLDELEITIPARRNLSELQLLSAKTEPHPARSSTVLLKVSMINRAKIEQPLPWLEFSLKNSDGKIISRRSLSPNDYTHNNRINTSIGPRELKKITIELLSFPKHAAGYELKLLNK